MIVGDIVKVNMEAWRREYGPAFDFDPEFGNFYREVIGMVTSLTRWGGELRGETCNVHWFGLPPGPTGAITCWSTLFLTLIDHVYFVPPDPATEEPTKVEDITRKKNDDNT